MPARVRHAEDAAAVQRRAERDAQKARNAALNSAPHPERWPAPLTPVDAEYAEGVATQIQVEPQSPRVNHEYTMSASGLPINSGLTWHLSGSEPETWLTHKSDPYGNAQILWRSANSGVLQVEIFGREPQRTGKKIASTSFEIS